MNNYRPHDEHCSSQPAWVRLVRTPQLPPSVRSLVARPRQLWFRRLRACGAGTCVPRCCACSPSSRCTVTRSSRSFRPAAAERGAQARAGDPTLQLLADEGLVTAEETAGKKVFSLTEAGTAAVADMAEQAAPWDEAAQSNTGAPAYREAAGKLMQAIWQIGTSGLKAPGRCRCRSAHRRPEEALRHPLRGLGEILRGAAARKLQGNPFSRPFASRGRGLLIGAPAKT